MRTAEDRLYDRLEAAETAKHAMRQRRELGWEGLDRIDPLALESVEEIWTVYGRMPFRLRIVDDDVRERSGRTTCEDGILVARIPESIRRRARFGEGCARFDVAQQLGHATLGHPAIMATLLKKHREPLLEGGRARKVLTSAYDSFDFQAGVFAATLLIGNRVGTEAASPEDLSVRYGIDVLTARVFFVELAATLSF
jgi:hypothetical protein